MDKHLKTRFEGLNTLISRTPLLEVNYSYKGEDRVMYIKAEHLNFTGSIKDRMAFHIIQKAYKTGVLKPGATIFEATSGNTGISFSAIGRALGHDVIIYMPDWMSEERKKLISSFGAQIKSVSKEQGGFLGSIRMADEAAAAAKLSFLPHQFSNSHNCEAHYITTGPEICRQLDVKGLKPDAFIAGVGTGGSVMGVGGFMRSKFSDVKVYPLEPSNSPTLSTGNKVGSHRIQGISDEFIPSIVELDKLDEVISVDDGDSIIMAQKLAQQLGLGVGISSGANFLGGVIAQNKLGKKAVITTVFADDNKKYLSTNLIGNEPVKEGFLSSDIVLKSFSAIDNCDKKYNTEWVF